MLLVMNNDTFFCKNCERNIKMSRVIVMSDKVVCPLCYGTIKRVVSKNNFKQKLQEQMNKKERGK